MLEKNGHFIANHSMTHARSSQLSLDEFKKEIISAENVLATCSNLKKWFRYPHLDHGSQEKRRNSLNCIKKLGYLEGFVSINTFDWHIDQRLQEAIQQKKVINYDALRNVYLTLIEKWINATIDHYRKKLGEDMIHTLLLHDNDLNALYLFDIINMIQNRGWNIVSPEKAFSQPLLLGNELTHLEWMPDSLSCANIDNQLRLSNFTAGYAYL